MYLALSGSPVHQVLYKCIPWNTTYNGTNSPFAEQHTWTVNMVLVDDATVLCGFLSSHLQNIFCIKNTLWFLVDVKSIYSTLQLYKEIINDYFVAGICSICRQRLSNASGEFTFSSSLESTHPFDAWLALFEYIHLTDINHILLYNRLHRRSVKAKSPISKFLQCVDY